MDINAANIVNILELELMESLNSNISSRQLARLREILKRVLIDKYFPFAENCPGDLETLDYGSVRGRTIRRLLRLFQNMLKHNNAQG
jgi:hypothetical protein